MEFTKIDGTVIKDVAQYLRDYIESKDGEIDIMIGCDSLPKAQKYATYTTVIAIYTVGKGAHLMYQRETRVKTKDLYDRLWKEVVRSMEVAKYLKSQGILDIKKIRGLDMHLHVDVNPDPGNGANKSNAVFESAVGFITSMGFKCSTKPDAPAASYAADCICRGKEIAGFTE